MTLKTITVVLIFCLTSSVSHASARNIDIAQASFDRSLKKYDLNLITYLEMEKNTQLLSYLDELKKQGHNNNLSELKYKNELDSLYSTRKNHEAALTKLISFDSKSPIPWLLRAYHYYGKAWQSRGQKFIHKVSNMQIDGMRYYLDLALSDLEKSIEIDPDNFASYLLRGQIYSMESSGKYEAQKSFTKALEILPQSYNVRNILLNFSTPRWGGSIKKMQFILNNAKAYYKINPELKRLKSTTYEETADRLKNRHSAIAAYREALKHGDRSRLRVDLAKKLLKIGFREEACLHLNKAIELNPPRWASHKRIVNCQ